MRHTTPATVLLLASTVLLGACSGGPAIKGLDPDPVLSTSTLPSGAISGPSTARTSTGVTVRYINPFAPETLRIHPLTRFVTDPVDGDPRIDAHFELFDTHRDPVKALGVISFQLYRDDESSGGSPIQLERWQVDLTDPAANAEPYDRVTRTYRLSLRGVPESVSQSSRLLLLAQFTTPDGQTLSATHRF
ncbi:MAG: hypothetical protein ACF8MJ_12195 [Phycisphaerales bacterium JB050]